MPHRRRMERPKQSDKMPGPADHTGHQAGPPTNTANSPASENHPEGKEPWLSSELSEAPMTPLRRRLQFDPPGPPPDKELPPIPAYPVLPLNVPTRKGSLQRSASQREKRAGRLWDVRQPAIQDPGAGEEELNRLLEEVSLLQWTIRSEAATPADPEVKSDSARKKKQVRFAEAGEGKELQGTEEGEGLESKDED